ncbi:MAG: hypothetical protein JRI70_06670 [Deltaproteobacteria bacterium]|nr:hypothetical protein [Deltaproteobacteria bacterium]MBW2172236.1 hypothetical protein [Deltaproteobacteria bacterium]
MWTDVFNALKAYDFQLANKILGSMDVLTVLKNPWVIVVMVIICVYLAIWRGENAVITFVSVPAILVVFQKTVQGMNVMELEHNSQNLAIFIGGFLVIAGINLYFHFVR